MKNVLLTNDLTEKVMQEAILIGANVIISYHPPLFKEFKRISQNNWKDRLVTQGLAQKLMDDSDDFVDKHSIFEPNISIATSNRYI